MQRQQEFYVMRGGREHYVGLALTMAEKAALAQAAEEECITLSAYIRKILVMALRERGTLPARESAA